MSEIKPAISETICLAKTLSLVEKLSCELSSKKTHEEESEDSTSGDNQQETEAFIVTFCKDLTPSKMDIKILHSVIMEVIPFNLHCILLITCESELEGTTQGQEQREVGLHQSRE